MLNKKDELFCNIALESGFVTKDQIEKAINIQNTDEGSGQIKPIAAYLLDLNFISKSQLVQIIELMKKASSEQTPTKVVETDKPDIQEQQIEDNPDHVSFNNEQEKNADQVSNKDQDVQQFSEIDDIPNEYLMRQHSAAERATAA